MTSRAFILDQIRKAKPATRPLPVVPAFEENAPVDLIEAFEKRLLANHAVVLRCHDMDSCKAIIKEELRLYARVVSTINGASNSLSISPDLDPHKLNDVDACVLHGNIGVAENGAILISEENMPHRVLPFIVQHLIVAIPSKQIVANMHLAYQQADQRQGFSVFIAGPSKTADIEQSLVIGAHGPKKMTVVIIN